MLGVEANINLITNVTHMSKKHWIQSRKIYILKQNIFILVILIENKYKYSLAGSLYSTFLFCHVSITKWNMQSEKCAVILLTNWKLVALYFTRFPTQIARCHLRSQQVPKDGKTIATFLANFFGWLFNKSDYPTCKPEFPEHFYLTFYTVMDCVIDQSITQNTLLVSQSHMWQVAKHLWDFRINLATFSNLGIYNQAPRLYR